MAGTRRGCRLHQQTHDLFPLITADASPTPEDNRSAEGFIVAGPPLRRSTGQSVAEAGRAAGQSHEAWGNHRPRSLAMGLTWLAGTPKVGKRRSRRGKLRTQTQSLLSSTLTT
jgi:hypothetical protein